MPAWGDYRITSPAGVASGWCGTDRFRGWLGWGPSRDPQSPQVEGIFGVTADPLLPWVRQTVLSCRQSQAIWGGDVGMIILDP